MFSSLSPVSQRWLISSFHFFFFPPRHTRLFRAWPFALCVRTLQLAHSFAVAVCAFYFLQSVRPGTRRFPFQWANGPGNCISTPKYGLIYRRRRSNVLQYWVPDNFLKPDSLASTAWLSDVTFCSVGLCILIKEKILNDVELMWTWNENRFLGNAKYIFSFNHRTIIQWKEWMTMLQPATRGQSKCVSLTFFSFRTSFDLFDYVTHQCFIKLPVAWLLTICSNELTFFLKHKVTIVKLVIFNNTLRHPHPSLCQRRSLH